MFEILTIPFDRKQGCFDPDVIKDVTINKKVLHWQAHFFQSDGNIYWTVFLEYDPLLKDNPLVSLSDAQQHLYRNLAVWRKERSEKEGIPPFLIASNKDLEMIAYKAPKTKAQLQQFKGFGKKKIEKYADEILHIISNFYTSNPLA